MADQVSIKIQLEKLNSETAKITTELQEINKSHKQIAIKLGEVCDQIEKLVNAGIRTGNEFLHHMNKANKLNATDKLNTSYVKLEDEFQSLLFSSHTFVDKISEREHPYLSAILKEIKKLNANVPVNNVPNLTQLRTRSRRQRICGRCGENHSETA